MAGILEGIDGTGHIDEKHEVADDFFIGVPCFDLLRSVGLQVWSIPIYVNTLGFTAAAFLSMKPGSF